MATTRDPGHRPYAYDRDKIKDMMGYVWSGVKRIFFALVIFFIISNCFSTCKDSNKRSDQRLHDQAVVAATTGVTRTLITAPVGRWSPKLLMPDGWTREVKTRPDSEQVKVMVNPEEYDERVIDLQDLDEAKNVRFLSFQSIDPRGSIEVIVTQSAP